MSHPILEVLKAPAVGRGCNGDGGKVHAIAWSSFISSICAKASVGNVRVHAVGCPNVIGWHALV